MSSPGSCSRPLLLSHAHHRVDGQPSNALHVFQGRRLAWLVRMEEAYPLKVGIQLKEGTSIPWLQGTQNLKEQVEESGEWGAHGQ